MTPKKLPSGNYRVQVYSHKDQDGKKHYVSFTAPTRSECLRLAVEFQRNRDMTPAEMTLNDAFDRWLSLQEPILSPSTMREYRRLKPLFGSLLSLRVDRITSADLQRFVSEYSIGRKAKTVKNAYGFLTSVLSTYTDKRFKVKFSQDAPVRYSIPDKDTMKALLDMASPDMKVCIMLGGLYGLRRGEICGLDASDIDRENMTLHIHCDVVKGSAGWVKKEIPKTSTSDRIIPIDAGLLGLLPTEGPIYSKTPDRITKTFIQYRNALGLTCRFHDLRHYSASIRSAAGFPVSYNVAFHGWKSDMMLRKVYDNVNEDIRKEYDAKSVALVSDYLSGNSD